MKLVCVFIKKTHTVRIYSNSHTVLALTDGRANHALGRGRCNYSLKLKGALKAMPPLRAEEGGDPSAIAG